MGERNRYIEEAGKIEMLKSMLLENLVPEIRRGVIAANDNIAKTIDKIKEAALFQEHAFNSYHSSPSSSISNKKYPSPVYAIEVRAENANQGVEDFCHKLAKKVETLTTKVTDLARQQNKHLCYSCNRPGHIARFCPRKYSSRTSQSPEYTEMIPSFRYGRNSHKFSPPNPLNNLCVLHTHTLKIFDSNQYLLLSNKRRISSQ
ncbi:hypothetical protein AVEN_218101-1 [Araneus ventricosus]|uniref:CCHC-type domain-containing protein n=1 Tax=Araneus ventricosus TaxID=182803 RepID=A0A4Y2PIW0_ARAVE|nr:hypothetical protein AVEN_218101-1 [Araneus ventricosus]